MLDFMTVALLIFISSGVSAALFFYFRKKTHGNGHMQLMGALLAYGLSFLCMSFMGSRNQFYWFLVATIFYSYGIVFTVWSLRIFFEEAINAKRWMAIPLLVGLVYFLLLDNGPLRTRLIGGLFLLQYFIVMLDLVMLPERNQLNGRWVVFSSITLLALSMVVRLFQPNLSLSARPLEGGAYALLISYAVLLISLQLMVVGYLMMLHDKVETDLNHMVSKDVLTGVASRRALMSKLKEKMADAARAQEPLGVFMIDVDHFKRVNDLCGHQEGDRILSAVGKFLTSEVRTSDFVGRYGGEEFVVICPRISPAEAVRLAQRLCSCVGENISVNHPAGAWPITASIGIFGYDWRESEESEETVLLKADKALYAAKRTGRNKVCDFQSSSVEIA